MFEFFRKNVRIQLRSARSTIVTCDLFNWDGSSKIWKGMKAFAQMMKMLNYRWLSAASGQADTRMYHGGDLRVKSNSGNAMVALAEAITGKQEVFCLLGVKQAGRGFTKY
jgi:hypothetical protein